MLQETNYRYIVSVMSLRKLMTVLTLLLSAFLVLGFVAESNASTIPKPVNQNTEHAHENSWSENLRDRNWQVYLSPEVKQILTLEDPNPANHNPHTSLHDSGVTPMVNTETGVALWGNCRTINISTLIDSSLVEKEEMFNVVDGVTEVVSAYTGLTMSHKSNYTSTRIDSSNLQIPETGSILIIWVPKDSESLSSQQLGTTKVWHSVENDGTPTITRAQILLSEKIFEEYESGVIGRGDNIETAVMHEMTHAMGIGHSTHENSFMHTELTNNTFATIADIASLVFAGSRSC